MTDLAVSNLSFSLFRLHNILTPTIMSHRSASQAGGLIQRLTWWLLKYERVGVDEVGNKYYRKLEKLLDGTVAEKRFFKPSVRGEYDPLAVPPEWSQWLHKTREEAPSAEDIARGVAHREAFRQRVAELEAEDAKRRFQERTAGGSGAPDMGAFVQQLSSQLNKKPNK